MTETCRIQWIDGNGKPTPDENPAVGTVVLTRTYARGLGANGERVEVLRYPCCAQHKALGEAEGIFGHLEASDFPGFGFSAVWSFEPL